MEVFKGPRRSLMEGRFLDKSRIQGPEIQKLFLHVNDPLKKKNLQNDYLLIQKNI